MRLPYYGTKEDVPLPSGWSALRVDQLYEQLPIGFRRDLSSCDSEGEVPVVDQSVSGYLGFHSDVPGVPASPSSPVVTFANHTCAMRVHRRPFSVIQNVFPKIGKTGVCDTLYLYYCTNGRVKTSEYKGHHPEWRAGYVPLPPMPVQRRIVAILSAYDTLIENNTRRIQILEEMSQTIYRDWFVEFRFPGHPDVPRIESDRGPIPKGWSWVALGSRFDVLLGGTPSRRRPEFWTDGNIPWINSGKVNDLRVVDPTELITEEALRNSSTKLMPPKTTLVAITGATLGQVSYLEIEACANQSVVGVFDLKAECNELIYLSVCHQIESIIAKASGGAQQHINRAVIEETPLLMPSSVVLARFRELVEPVFDLIAALTRASLKLQAARDLLLPRLLSGDVDVSDLDIDTSGLVA